jgi:Fic-DOC domain mobile mystery protein B
LTHIPDLNLSPGNTPLEPGESAELIPSLATKSELDEWERKNILEAYEWALNPRRVKSSDPFTEPYLRELHRRMFHRTWKWAGTCRHTEKNIGVLVHEIRNRIPALLGDTRYWVDHHTFPPDEIAIRFHHQLVGVIHPFPNGNGRHARLHADVIAVKLARPEFTWGRNSIAGTGPAREAYIKALQAADNGSIQELLKFARS